MTLALTLMVRDEADIIRPFLEHHLAQGVDTVIVTDNGSVDGTAEILAEYAERGLVDLRHDPVHRKQQGETVTRMARDAATMYGADWVINADTDEFWLPVDRSLRLADVFSQLPREIQAFTIEVTDMIGPPALDGTGLQRLVYRDLRTTEQMHAVGLYAHATADAAHIGAPEITVHQGNHFVSLESRGTTPPELRLEVLHFPWRSWNQYRRKVDNAGRAYLASEHLTPSPNHHGMRDFRRLQDDTLYPSYLARHPDAAELAAGIESGVFVREDVIAESLDSPVADVPVDEATAKRERAIGVLLNGAAMTERLVQELRAELASTTETLRTAEHERGLAVEHVADLERQLDEFRARRSVRALDALSRTLHRRG